ncbi:polymer-forming cytoskeletal protein [Candidatus Saccharibacteria bacterium]|nr:polymer-forming cytoskeletal protein [Candidatus Saccharibacteria bacterium]
MRKYLTIAGLLILGSVVFTTTSGFAQSFRSGDNITVAQSETVDSALFAGGRNIDIAGRVNGDVYCAGMNVTVSGTVKGDVFCAAQTLRVSGVIEGSVKLAGQSVILSSPTVDKVGIAGQTVTIDRETEISQDVMLAGQDLSVNGVVGRDLAVAGQNVSIGNLVKRNVSGNVERLTLTSDAQVDGNIEYTSNNDLVEQQGASVQGNTTREQPKENQKENIPFKPIGMLYILFAMLIISLVLVLLFPRLFNKTNERISILPGKTALIGVAGIFLSPIVIGLLAATIVGIPLAILMFLAWIIVLFLSGPTLAYTIGKKVWKSATSPMLIMLVGSLLLVVLYVIPIIGFFAVLTAGILGTGAILSEMFNLAEPQAKIKKTKSPAKK